MISATFDSSVLIRAINFGGPAALLLGHSKAKMFRLDFSGPILGETCGVLREKFRKDGYTIADSYRRLKSIANLVKPTETLSIVKEDPDDDRILECAAAARSDYIVSEDKHLLRLGNFRGAPVVKIQDFLSIALRRGRRRLLTI